MGEFNTRNDANVVAKEANAHCTGVYDGFDDVAVVFCISPDASISSCLHFHALCWEIKSMTLYTGLANPSGSRLVVEVLRLGAIIAVVMTLGLYGMILVFVYYFL
jgi:hypothetical protein